MNSNFKIIYIAGAGHSGSTILQLSLATNKDYTFAIGEAYSYLQLKKRKRKKNYINVTVEDMCINVLFGRKYLVKKPKTITTY